MRFTGPLSLFASMAFVTGYLDVHSIRQYGVYITMITGNLVGGAVNSAYTTDSNLASLCYIMSVFTGYFGGILSCFLLEITKDKKKAFTILITLQALSILLTDIINYIDFDGFQFTELFLALTSGALLHWVVKFGFTTSLMTMNMIKLAEASFRLMYGISQGGSQLRGDVLILISMLIAFISGTWAFVLMEYLTVGCFTNTPLLVLLFYQVFLLHGAFSYYPQDPTNRYNNWKKAIESVLKSFDYHAYQEVVDERFSRHSHASDTMMSFDASSVKNNTNTNTNNMNTNMNQQDTFEPESFRLTYSEFSPSELHSFRMQQKRQTMQRAQLIALKTASTNNNSNNQKELESQVKGQQTEEQEEEDMNGEEDSASDKSAVIRTTGVHDRGNEDENDVKVVEMHPLATKNPLQIS